ncbi:MAG: hypothetical protein QNK37_25045 [Acidobacteriota bacterium]|nr:hypothetical protein [Acidobacteriota bacterium]
MSYGKKISDEITELIIAYETGYLMRSELLHFSIEKVNKGNVDEVWELLPGFIHEDIILYFSQINPDENGVDQNPNPCIVPLSPGGIVMRNWLVKSRILNFGCDIYLDTDIELNELSLSIARFLPCPHDPSELKGDNFTIYININNEFDPEGRYSDFLFYRYLVEVELNKSGEFGSFKNLIIRLLNFFWGNKMPAVAACDFEDILPNKGKKQFFES